MNQKILKLKVTYESQYYDTKAFAYGEDCGIYSGHDIKILQ